MFRTLRLSVAWFCCLLFLAYLVGCSAKQGAEKGSDSSKEQKQAETKAKQYTKAEELYADLAKLSPAERQQKLEEGAKKEGGTVQIYTVLDEEGMNLAKKIFSEKYPFGKVEYISGKSSDLFPRAQAEFRSGQYLVDILATGSQGLLAINKDFPMAKLYDLPIPQGYPKQYYTEWWASHASSPNVITWNTKIVSPGEAPKSYEDLLDPKWKGKVVIDIDPYHMIVAMLEKWGEAKTKEYLQKLIVDNKAQIRKGHTQEVDMLVAGEFPITIESYLYRVEAMRNQGAPLDWAAPDPTPAIIWPTGIANQAKHPNSAMLFMQIFLGKEFAEQIAKDGYTVANPQAKLAFPRLSYFASGEGLAKFVPNSPERTGKWEAQVNDIEKNLLQANMQKGK